MKTVHVPNKLNPKIVSLDRFLPYTPEDLGVVIAHSIRMRNRWKWFWPQFKANVPTSVLHNTTVVLHIRDGPAPVPDELKEVEESGGELIVLERRGASTVWANVAGIKANKSRIIARFNDDVEILSPNWVDAALKLFNEEPHWKILGLLASGGVRLGPKEPVYKVPFVDELLFHGDYQDISYVHGSCIIANRAVWMAYYSEMEEYCQFGQEDLRFSILGRADGVPAINFGAYFKHRGKSHQDIICGHND